VPSFKKVLNHLSKFSFAKKINPENLFLIYSIAVLLIGFCTYFVNYQNPQAPFWDENFHIASAEKYIQGSFFMENHPPLGKLFIAAGEVIWNPNKNVDKSEFIKTDYIKEFPQNYSFAGVRFFPTLFGFLSSFLFFLLLYLISKNSHLSFLFSSLFLFNNQIIVHFRGAMLESTQIFFALLILIYTVYLYLRDQKIKPREYLFLGLLVGLIASVKVNSLIMILVFPFLFLTKTKAEFENYKAIIEWLKKLTVKGTFFVFGIGLVFMSINYLHLAIAHKQLPEKENNNGYKINSEYQDVLNKKDYFNPLNGYKGSVAWYYYQDQYNKGVPKLDEAKPDENGSYPMDWLLGRKAISYRWEKYPIEKKNHFSYNPFEPSGSKTISLEEYSKLPEDQKNDWVVVVKYLYIQNNPMITLVSLISLILGLSLVFGVAFFDQKISDNAQETSDNSKQTTDLEMTSNKKLFGLIIFFLFSYIFYMLSALRTERVLYIYHYIIPSIFLFVLGFLVFLYRFSSILNSSKGSFQNRLYFSVGLVVILIFINFVFFAPFTYYLPLSGDEFEVRNWFDFWGLKDVSK
jgi:dolichyl-phosphate-mannose--protein O-mannosyl transferase